MRIRVMPVGQYDLVAQYDAMEGLVQGEGTRVVNMFRYYEEEDTRYCVHCLPCTVTREQREHL